MSLGILLHLLQMFAIFKNFAYDIFHHKNFLNSVFKSLFNGPWTLCLDYKIFPSPKL